MHPHDPCAVTWFAYTNDWSTSNPPSLTSETILNWGVKMSTPLTLSLTPFSVDLQ